MELPPIAGATYEANRVIEGLCVALTAARLVQAVSLSQKIKSGEPIAASLTGIIATDIADGVIARKLGVDTPIRRITDAVVDRATIGMAFTAIYEANPRARPYIGLIAARDATVIAGNTFNWFRTGETLRGGDYHHVAQPMLAVFALAATSGGERSTRLFGKAASGIYLGLAIDYVAAWKSPQFGKKENAVRTIPGFSWLRSKAR